MSSSRARNALEVGALRVLRRIWAWLPERVALGAGALTGLMAGSVLRIRRSEVDRHLAFAFPERAPEWRARIARASYAHLGREAALLLRMEGWTRDELLARVDFQGLDALRRAVESGEGAVVLTGHLGNWELAGAALAASGIPLDVVGKGMSNRGFEAELVATRARLGMRVIDVGDAPKRVLRALGEGRAVAMLVDQNAHRSKVFVPFFGKRAATARGPALLALRTGAPIFLGAALRTPGAGGRYAISMDAVDFHPTGDLESDVLSLSTEFARLLEAAVRAAPEQYFWQHKRWKTRPPEEPAPGA